MLAFRSLDPFRALREPDRRRRDEERLSRSEQRTLSKTENNHLTGKAPYKFESGLLQRRVLCEPECSGTNPIDGGQSSQPLTIKVFLSYSGCCQFRRSIPLVYRG